MPIFLLTAAFGILIVVMLLGLARYMDRRVRLLASDENVADLQATLDALRAEQAHLLERVEHLEAIVTTDEWDARHTERPSLDVPDAAPESPREAPSARRERP